MDYVGRIGNLFSSLNNFYNEINPATLSGAIDIIVVEQENGNLASSPFHVRFGKLSVLLPQEKKVEIHVNGEKIPYLMKVGEAGEAFFVFETSHEVPEEFQTSPILQALAENRIDIEDPPFLDISERNQVQKDTQEDTFEDDEDEENPYVPAELQSPKMIIEEQMDKVVTKMDPYQSTAAMETKNTVYPMEDGSSILEREVTPEAITKTTIAKERFIVRPVDGNIRSNWMDVTHTLLEEPESVLSSSDKLKSNTHKGSKATNEEGESIMLDISGYKTHQDKDDETLDEDDPTAKTPGFYTPATSRIAEDEKLEPWGWGKAVENKSNEIAHESSAIPTDTELDNENETVQLKSGHVYRIEMSLCGFASFGYDEAENDLLFKDKQVSYDDFVHNPSILNDPRLVFRYDHRYYAAMRSSPLFTSLLVFKRPIEQKEPLNKVSDSRDTYSYGRGWRQWLSRSSTGDPIPLAESKVVDNANSVGESIAPTIEDDKQQMKGERTTFTTTTKTTSVGWSPDHNHHDENDIFTQRKMYAKTLRLTSDQLQHLNLKKGVNTISFSVNSAYQGTATCAAKIFFWDHDIQVVISDIDGTITKSDAMGHLMAMIGKDWTHDGVAQLYTDIANNGYHFLYLTSRAIGQADYTRDYLKKILQNNYQLPDGPVVMSPDRLFTSLHREVIMRKPEMFKMACLKDIQRLFGGRDPFYAGFGNRITDAISYRSVNVPSSRIFTIDAQGCVKLELVTGFKSSYIDLNDLVDQIFPPINKTVNEEYNDFNYWKAPMLEIDIPELEEEGPIPTSPKPKPIKPDPNALPKESVVAYTPEPKRGLLRSFTSRSSKSTVASVKSSPSRSPSISSITSNMSSVSLTPSAQTMHSSSSTPTVTMNSAHKEINSTTTSPSTSPLSLPADTTHKEAIEPVQRPRSSSSGIMSKVIGGVFSRKTAIASQPIITRKNTELQEEEEDEFYSADIDDLDLDKIPFI
ncbi:unnamed protein product [Mucor hiemalis]